LVEWPIQARFWLEWGCSHVTEQDPPDELDCPHAVGTDTFSRIMIPRLRSGFRQRAQTPARRLNILLLPSPHSTPSLRSVAQGRLRLLTADASCRIFESALERVRRSYRLQVYGYVVMPEHVHLLLSEPQRDTSSGRTAPLKPKDGLNGPPVLLEDGKSKSPP
jgi:hypothetical protein